MPSADELLVEYRHARSDGRVEQARRALLEAGTLCRSRGDERHLVHVLKGLAQLARDTGTPAGALPAYAEAVSVARRLQDPLFLAHTVRHLGDLHAELGDVVAAGQCFDEALLLYRATPGRDDLDFANALRSAALWREATADRAGAARLWAEAGDQYQRAGIDAGIAECARRLAALTSEAS